MLGIIGFDISRSLLAFKGLPAVCEQTGEMVQFSVAKSQSDKHLVANFSGAKSLPTCKNWEQTIEAKIPEAAKKLTVFGFKNSPSNFAVAEEGGGQAHYFSPLPKGVKVTFPVELKTPSEKAVIPRLFSWWKDLIGAKNPPDENLTIGSIPLESRRIAFKSEGENSQLSSKPISKLHPIVQKWLVTGSDNKESSVLRLRRLSIALTRRDIQFKESNDIVSPVIEQKGKILVVPKSYYSKPLTKPEYDTLLANMLFSVYQVTNTNSKFK